MFRHLKNKRGVALLIVVSMLAVMSSIVIDFIDQALVNHQVSLNVKRRMQAYYLAKSGLNFGKILMLYSKKLKSQIDSAGAAGSAAAGAMGYQPLYRMFPMASSVFRSIVASAPEEGAEEPEEIPADPAADAGGSGLMEGESFMQPTGGFFDRKKAEEFLSFEGDFDNSISEESAKFSLNTISKMTSTSPSYDLYKKVLLQLLMNPSYKTLFENQEQDAEELTHAIFDYADLNTSVNEFDQVERGNEDSEYGDSDHRAKNGKYLTLSEMRLVPKMSDDIFEGLKGMLTVYHTNDKVNVCLADEKYLDAIIVHYTTHAECTTPIKKDDADMLKELRELVLSFCPDVTAMASALNVRLGIKDAEEVADAAESGTAETQQTSSKAEGCKIQFQDLITDANDVFAFQATGTVGDVTRTIIMVMDTSSSSAASWKNMYYQVQ